MKKRTKEVHNLAVQAYEKLEPELQKVAEQLQDPMEMSYFFSVLANKVLEHRMNTLLATEKATITMFVSLKQGTQVAPETSKPGICIETAMKMIGDTDGKQGRSWNPDVLRKVARNCLEGCDPTTYAGKPGSKEQKKFAKVWRKLQGKGCQRSKWEL